MMGILLDILSVKEAFYLNKLNSSSTYSDTEQSSKEDNSRATFLCKVKC